MVLPYLLHRQLHATDHFVFGWLWKVINQTGRISSSAVIVDASSESPSGDNEGDALLLPPTDIDGLTINELRQHDELYFSYRDITHIPATFATSEGKDLVKKIDLTEVCIYLCLAASRTC